MPLFTSCDQFFFIFRKCSILKSNSNSTLTSFLLVFCFFWFLVYTLYLYNGPWVPISTIYDSFFSISNFFQGFPNWNLSKQGTRHVLTSSRHADSNWTNNSNFFPICTNRICEELVKPTWREWLTKSIQQLNQLAFIYLSSSQPKIAKPVEVSFFAKLVDNFLN